MHQIGNKEISKLLQNLEKIKTAVMGNFRNSRWIPSNPPIRYPIDAIVDDDFLYNMLYEFKNARELSDNIPKICKKCIYFIIFQI